MLAETHRAGRRALESRRPRDNDTGCGARLALMDESEAAPIQDLHHVRGAAAGRLIVEYGDYECPYSRQAYHAIQRVEAELGGELRFGFRHFPLMQIHPRALAASAAAEAATLQGRFWEMHDLLFQRQRALEEEDLRRYAAELGLDVQAFDRDRGSDGVLEHIRRDVESGIATGEVRGTPTLFIDGFVHSGAYDPTTLREALTR
jgi:protein-disulfide isomerase